MGQIQSNLELRNCKLRPVHKLQVRKAVWIEFALSKSQKVFKIKWQKVFTFAIGYILPFHYVIIKENNRIRNYEF